MDAREELVSIGERIRNYRRRRKLTQTELGKLIGYSLNGIAKIEQGTSDPKISSLMKIADALDVKIQSLLTSEVSIFSVSVEPDSEDLFLINNMMAEFQALVASINAKNAKKDA